MTRAVLLPSLLALVITKAADIVTTVRGLRRGGIAGERNPLARGAMRRWGVGGGIAAITVLWLLVVVLTYVSAWHSPAATQWVVAGMGFLVAWGQWEVARFNVTRRATRFTAFLRRSYESLSRKRDR